MESHLITDALLFHAPHIPLHYMALFGLCMFIPFSIKIQNNFYRYTFSGTPYASTWAIWMNGVTAFFYTISSAISTKIISGGSGRSGSILKWSVVGLAVVMLIISSFTWMVGTVLSTVAYFHLTLALESLVSIFYGLGASAAQGLVSELERITKNKRLRQWYNIGMFFSSFFTSTAYLITAWQATSISQSRIGGCLNFFAASMLFVFDFFLVRRLDGYRTHFSHQRSTSVGVYSESSPQTSIEETDSQHSDVHKSPKSHHTALNNVKDAAITICMENPVTENHQEEFSFIAILSTGFIFYVIGIALSGATSATFSSMFFQEIESSGKLGDIFVPLTYFVESLGSVTGSLLGLVIHSFGHKYLNSIVVIATYSVTFIVLFSLCNLPNGEDEKGASQPGKGPSTNKNGTATNGTDTEDTKGNNGSTDSSIIYINAPRLITSDAVYFSMVLLFGIINSLAYSICYRNSDEDIIPSWKEAAGAIMSTSNDIGSIIGTFFSFGIQASMCACNSMALGA